MRVCWVPHAGLRGVYRGREKMVLDGRTGEQGGGLKSADEPERSGEDTREDVSQQEKRIFSEDGWAEMMMSLEDFDYDRYGIRLKDEKV